MASLSISPTLLVSMGLLAVLSDVEASGLSDVGIDEGPNRFFHQTKIL